MSIQKSITEQIKVSSLKNTPTETLHEKFGESFQTNLFKCFITDQKLWNRTHTKLTSDLFSKLHGYIYNLFLKYFTKYNYLPSKEILLNMVNEDSLLTEHTEFITNIINDIFNISDKVNQLDYYKDAIKEFIVNRNVMEAFIDSVDLFNAGKYREIADVITESVKEVDVDDNLGLDFLNCGEFIGEDLHVETVPTPFVGINTLLKGGLGRRELGLILGGTGAGKSWILQTIGAHALLNDYNVIYYTMEMADREVARRFASIIQEKNPDDVTDKDIIEIKHTLKRKGLSSRLFIVEFPTKSADITTLKNNTSSLYHHYSFKPDLILVDYADLMKSKTIYSEKRFELSSIYEDLRGFGGEINSALWTVSQVNRSGYNKRIITVDNIAEDFNKSTICDFILSVGRDVNDRRGGMGQAFVAKNRRGRDSIEFDMEMKFDEGKITMELDANEILDASRFKEKRPDIDGDEQINALLETLDD